MKKHNEEIPVEIKQIGERIKAERKARGMTQSELAGDGITRSMLSLIESGTAIPSLVTLAAIAKRLGMTIGELTDSTEEKERSAAIKRIKEAAKRKDYEKVIEYIKESEMDPETTELGREILIKAGDEAYSTGKITKACGYYETAEGIFGETEESRTKKGMILLSESCTESEKRSRYINEAPEELFKAVFSRKDGEIYVYACRLLLGVKGRSYSVPDEHIEEYRKKLETMIEGMEDGVYKEHIKAKLEIAGADYITAKNRLTGVIEKNKKLVPTVQYDIYGDLEICCKCCGDFENAYKYSGKRLELQKRIK